MYIALILMIILFFFLLSPLITIAALNGLGLTVAYNLVTYLSALWFHIIFAASASNNKK